jgi:hypothetical protein
MTQLTGKRQIKFDPDLANRVNKEYADKVAEPVESAPEMEGFVHVPSVNLYFSRDLAHKEKNWYECHELLQKEGYKMATIHEFVELLKYARTNDKELFLTIFNEYRITDLAPGEWLDARFTKEDNTWKINYTHKIRKNIQLCESDKLEPCVMYERDPEIDLDDWLNNANSQGLPKPDVKPGRMLYTCPTDGFVARFDILNDNRPHLDCNMIGEIRRGYLGVRRVKENPGGETR